MTTQTPKKTSQLIRNKSMMTKSTPRTKKSCRSSMSRRFQHRTVMSKMINMDQNRIDETTKSSTEVAREATTTMVNLTRTKRTNMATVAIETAIGASTTTRKAASTVTGVAETATTSSTTKSTTTPISANTTSTTICSTRQS